MQDIHDIRPPVQVGMDPALLKIAWIALILVLLTVLTILILGYFRRRGKEVKSNLPMLPPPPPPLGAALKDLDRLEALMVADPRLFYFRLTEIIKRFLGKVFTFKAPEMNTQELISFLKDLPALHGELFSDMRELLTFSDAVKYAGEYPPFSSMELHLAFARDFVTLADGKMAQQPLQVKEEENRAERGENYV